MHCIMDLIIIQLESQTLLNEVFLKGLNSEVILVIV